MKAVKEMEKKSPVAKKQKKFKLAKQQKKVKLAKNNFKTFSVIHFVTQKQFFGDCFSSFLVFSVFLFLTYVFGVWFE